MADKAQQDLGEHIKQTAKGLYDDDSESDPFKSEASYIGRSVKEQRVKEILNDVIDNIFRNPSSGEQASSSGSQAVYPTGVNPVVIPKAKGRPAGSRNKPKDKAKMERLLYGD